MITITPEVEKILAEMQSKGCPIIETWVEPLIRAGFGGLPCLVIRNMGRTVVRLSALKSYLDGNFDKNNHLRYISTYPECIVAIKAGQKNPSIPMAYHRG